MKRAMARVGGAAKAGRGRRRARGKSVTFDEARAGAASDWFTRLVAEYLRRHYAVRDRARARKGAAAARDARTESERAREVIRRACVRSALAGAAAGAVTTGAELFAAGTEGAGTVVALPATAAAIGGETLYRAHVHLQMTCDLADIFDLRFDPKDPQDLWRLYALVFHTEEHARRADDARGAPEADPGRGLVSRVVRVQGPEVGRAIGSKLLGESVLRNAVPVVGIALSSMATWTLTRRLGDSVRRYARYRRALADALSAEGALGPREIELLVEGLWFIFSADGRLAEEEAATLASLLKRLEPHARAAVQKRFTEDEHDWSERLRRVPESRRDAFLHALEVAAALDKKVSLPERKILRRAARKLGREYDPERVERMVREFVDVGVLREQPHRRPVRA